MNIFEGNATALFWRLFQGRNIRIPDARIRTGDFQNIKYCYLPHHNSIVLYTYSAFICWESGTSE